LLFFFPFFLKFLLCFFLKYVFVDFIF
jgi:hypothetical protein